MNNIEILAPVGSEENLKAAVLSGADAVYFGLSDFNARRNAQNFTDEQIENAIKYYDCKEMSTAIVGKKAKPLKV